MSARSSSPVTHEDTVVGPLSPNMQLQKYALGDESMLKTLEGLGYPGPALLVIREMVPTPFDLELMQINQFLANWGRAVNNSHVAEFRSHKGFLLDGVAMNPTTPAVRFKLKFDGLNMILYIGYRAFDGMFESVVGNMSCNVLDWQEVGCMCFQLEGAELQMVQMKRWQYRNLLDYCFNSPRQCQLCFGRNSTDHLEMCEECQYVSQPKECQICHQKKGRTTQSKFKAYGYIEDPACNCEAHNVCWLETFHNARLDLQRGRCEMCQETVLTESDSDYESYGDEDSEPAAKRRRLE